MYFVKVNRQPMGLTAEHEHLDGIKPKTTRLPRHCVVVWTLWAAKGPTICHPELHRGGEACTYRTIPALPA